MIEGNKK